MFCKAAVVVELAMTHPFARNVQMTAFKQKFSTRRDGWSRAARRLDDLLLAYFVTCS